MKKFQRRDTEVFCMSFLDCICCGFGAIILLLVLSEFGVPIQLEKSRVDMHGQIAKLQQELFELRGTSIVLERELRGRIEQLSVEQKRVARLRGDLTAIEGKHKASIYEEESTKKISETLEEARLALIEETRVRQVSGHQRIYDQPIAGVPIDSEWVIFVVDTSGSMQSQNWRRAEKRMEEVLNIDRKSVV